MRTLFLHNKAISYRLSFFERLSSQKKHDLTFWFYHENAPTAIGKSFPFISIFGRYEFSFAVLINLLRAREFDAVIIAASYSYELLPIYLIARAKKLPIYLWSETWNWPGKKSVKNILFATIEKRIAKSAVAVACAGTQTMQWMASAGVAQEQIFLVPNASKRYNPRPTTKKQTKKQLVSISRLLPRKGVDILIKSLSHLPNANYELHIYGDGNPEYVAHCKSLAATQPISVTFHGFASDEDIQDAFSNADLLVYPSINHSGMAEPWGLLINEAVSAHLPIITTQYVASAYDLVDSGKNGYIIERVTPATIASAIEQALKIDSSVVKKTSVEKMQEYNYDAMAQQFIEMLNKK